MSRTGRPAARAWAALLLAADLLAIFPAPTQAAGSADEPPLHGARLAAAYCAGCHGADGNSTVPQYPKIAGQRLSYLRAQLEALKHGARHSDLMSGPASAISDAQIDDLARYYAAQAVKPDAVQDRELAILGARLYFAPARHAPACATCHDAASGRGAGHMGMMGGGMMSGGGMMGNGGMMGGSAAVPKLKGQHAAYTLQQLDAFADGSRRGTVMGPIAAGLTERQRRALAEYLSGLR